jgi:anti-sigma-K factor RskA
VIPEHLQDDAAMYAMGLLPAPEARQLETAIARDPELAALVASLRDTTGAFAATVQPIHPPPALRSRLMSQIQAQQPSSASSVPADADSDSTSYGAQPPSPSARLIPASRQSAGNWGWAVAACFAFLSVWLGYQRYQLRLTRDNFVIRDHAQQLELDRVQTHDIDTQRQLDTAKTLAAATAKENAGLQAQLLTLRNQLQGATDQIATLNARDEISKIKIATLASLSKNLPQAIAIVAWDGDSQHGLLKTANIPAARADQDYQLWVIDASYKQPISAGIFHPGQEAPFHPLQSISNPQKFAISLEKKGGAPPGQGPQGPVMLIGE